jgi:hypothetical protein
MTSTQDQATAHAAPLSWMLSPWRFVISLVVGLWFPFVVWTVYGWFLVDLHEFPTVSYWTVYVVCRVLAYLSFHPVSPEDYKHEGYFAWTMADNVLNPALILFTSWIARMLV